MLDRYQQKTAENRDGKVIPGAGAAFGEASLPLRGPAAGLAVSAMGSLNVLGGIIDRLWMAILVVDAGGRILVCNAAAEQILAQRDGLMRIVNTLTTNRPVETRALAGEISKVLTKLVPMSASDPPYGIARATRPSGLSPYVLLIAPFAAEGADGTEDRAAMVVVSDLELPVPDCGRHLRIAFELTEAEVQVALSLLNGKTPAEIAEARGVRLSTIRSQVKAIFAKTGTTRQSELVKLLSRIPNLR